MPDLPEEIDPPLAAELLADWGFLVDPGLPPTDGTAYLLVAIRARPTLRHYDPELVEYWASDERLRGVRTSLAYATRLPLERDFAWGSITIVDRLGVVNEYLTFGGRLSAARVEGVSACVFRSPVPLLRRGGHSQGWDQAAQNVGGFLGRVRAAAGYAPAFEALATASDPMTRYAAFVRQLMTRYRRSEYLRERYPALWALMLREERRLRDAHAPAWAAAHGLLRAAADASGSRISFGM
jgi:hypothetical protein